MAPHNAARFASCLPLTSEHVYPSEEEEDMTESENGYGRAGHGLFDATWSVLLGVALSQCVEHPVSDQVTG